MVLFSPVQDQNVQNAPCGEKHPLGSLKAMIFLELQQYCVKQCEFMHLLFSCLRYSHDTNEKDPPCAVLLHHRTEVSPTEIMESWKLFTWTSHASSSFCVLACAFSSSATIKQNKLLVPLSAFLCGG